MRKFLRLSLVCLMAMVCGTVFAQQTATFDFTGDEAYGMTLLSGNTSEYNADHYECTEGNVTLTLNGRTRWWKTKGGNELRFYSNSNFNISVPKGYAITSITLDAKTPSNFSTNIGSYDNGAWTGNTDKVTFNCTLKESNTPISTIKVTYEEASAPIKKDPKLAFSEQNVTVALNGDFTEPTLTKETTETATYSSSDEDVATVDATTGEVTLVSVGTTKITATVKENAEYSAGSASYTLNVTQPVVTETGIPYEESFADGIGSFTIDDVNLSDGLNYVWKHDDNSHYMKASAFVNGNKAAESWLVSPTINLENVSEATLAFEQCINKYFGTVENEATLWIKAGDAEWEQVTITYPTLPSKGNWSDWEKQTIDLEKYVGKKIKVGFKYVSTTEAAGTWEIRNFSVTGLTSGITDITIEKEFDENAPIYNLSGQRVDKNAKGILIQNGKKFIRR